VRAARGRPARPRPRHRLPVTHPPKGTSCGALGPGRPRAQMQSRVPRGRHWRHGAGSGQERLAGRHALPSRSVTSETWQEPIRSVIPLLAHASGRKTGRNTTWGPRTPGPCPSCGKAARRPRGRGRARRAARPVRLRR
jgi:hypothetical protein